MATSHSQYHFSATLQTDDVAVLHCLRALCQYWAGGPYPQIGWGGTNQDDWKSHGGEFVVRFTTAARRASFFADAKRLLAAHWSEVSRNDNDPATPQR
ncbi:hypothetical protein [Nitrosovibrio sp. Nv6]|uniref:hypothetical protein n=1 Tax=Nitrosovibrio sp. Nv6 TaxID=1855340 RepID=UPI0008B51CA8|nr:hypothetical protein [Nitrosovibrio sp. Nv6]SEP39594.1 hypothetical protein SAMN05216316_2812 [Nitrosovibrio sp. Nv6]